MKLATFAYMFFSMLGAAALQWYFPHPQVTAFWQIPVLMVAVVLWFLGAAATDHYF